MPLSEAPSEHIDHEVLYDFAPCGLVILSPNGTIQVANKTFLSWLDYEAEDLLNKKRFQDLLPVGDRIFYETHFSPLLQMQRFASEINFSVQKKDGSKFPALVSATETQDAEGKPLLIHLALFAIRDRKKFEAELMHERIRAESALRAKADFVSLLTHEVRTPLNSIIGVSHLLASTDLSSEQQKYSDMLASASENLMALLNSILDYSKIDSGKARIEAIPFEFERTVRTTALAFQAPAMRNGISLHIEISERIPEYLMGDPVKIGQIVTNLVGNAIKFTQNGSVTLRVEIIEDAGDKVDLLVKVIDTGIGIPENIIPKIFEEYSQADASTGTTYGGTGLGLAIVNRLVSMHGSKINVISVVGKGTTFSFQLRLAKAAKPEAQEDEAMALENALAGVRVLVADDSEDNQMILQLIMERWGVEISAAANGEEVLTYLDTANFDLILMDLRMPVMDGYATTAAIRKLSDQQKARIPIIAFSASATLGDKEIVSNLKFQDVLGKPFKPSDLFAKVARLTKRKSDPSQIT